MRAAIAILLLIGTLAAAHAFGLGKEGKMFGRLGSISNKQTGGGPPISGALLLEDGSSILLLEGGAGNLCLEGGC